MGLAPEALEAVWRQLAEAVDRAGPQGDRLMLARLALLLAEQIGDADLVARLIDDAGQDLPPDPSRDS